MTATAPRARALRVLWSAALVGLLLGSLLLGFAASGGTVEPSLHGMIGVLAAGLAVASHVRRGRGWDLLAVLLLGATVGLGTMVQAGSSAPTLHLALALPAIVLSGGLHLGRRSVSRVAAAGGAAVAEETRR